MPQPALYLHIGLEKTGTSTLQRGLFACHPEISYLGKFDGSAAHRKWNYCRDEHIQKIMSQVLFKRWKNPDLVYCARRLRYSVERVPSKAACQLFSWETLGNADLIQQQTRARNLRRLFGDLKVLVTIRHPVAAAESAYLQYLTNEYIGHNAKRGRKPEYISFARWIRAGVRHPVRTRYPDVVRLYADLLGPESVQVFVFENFVRRPVQYIHSVCEFLQIDARKGIDLLENRHDNPRWTVEHLRRLEELESVRWRRILFRLSGQKRRKQMLGRVPGDSAWDAPPAEFEVPSPLVEELESLTRSGNRWLNDKWNLGLDQLGYPL